MMQKQSWYNTSLFYIILLVLVVLVITMLAKNDTVGKYYTKPLKEKIEKLEKEIQYKDSIYISLLKERDKVKVIRERILINNESDRIKELEAQLSFLKNLKKEPNRDTSLVYLKNYFDILLKR